MSERLEERLSALVDDELPDAEAPHLMDKVARDDELRRTWGRYHLIGDVLRQPCAVRAGVKLSERIRTQLTEEPTVLAPAAASDASHRWLKPVAGVAVAASVAVMAVLVAPRFVGVPADPDMAQSPMTEMYAKRGGARWNVNEPAVESRLNRYLADHSENVLPGGVKGMLPYVTIVDYGQDGR